MKSTFIWLFHNTLKPRVIFPSILLGIILGLLSPQWSFFYSNVTELYLKLLQMAVIPLVITSIISSIGNILLKHSELISLRKVACFFAGGLLLTGFIAVFFGLFFHPGSHIQTAIINNIMKDTNTQTNLLNTNGNGNQLGILGLINSMIPNNIFYAFSNGQNLSILFISAVLAFTLGIQKTKNAKRVIGSATALYQAFLNMIKSIMYFLPIGLICIFASSIAIEGTTILILLAKLIGTILFISLFVIIIQITIISYTLKSPYLTVIRNMIEPFTVAFASSSSFATLPTTLKTLKTKFKLDPDLVETVLPLGIIFNQQAAAIRFIVTSFFVAEVMGHPIFLYQLPIIALCGILAGIASSGIPGIACVTLISLVLNPLNLPSALGIMLLVVIEPVIDPIITIINVSGNCATLVLLNQTQAKNEVLTLTPNNLEREDLD